MKLTIKKSKKVNKAKLLKKLKKDLWQLAKNYCRKRWGNVCFTCGAIGLESSNWQTSHGIPSMICPFELDYSPLNLRPCCYSCNIDKGGYGMMFYRKLVENHGIEHVNILFSMLENPIILEPKLEDYYNYIDKYKQLIKNLQ